MSSRDQNMANNSRLTIKFSIIQYQIPSKHWQYHIFQETRTKWYDSDWDLQFKTCNFKLADSSV